MSCLNVIGTKNLENGLKEEIQSSSTEEEGSDGDHDDMKHAKCLKIKCTEENFKIHYPYHLSDLRKKLFLVYLLLSLVQLPILTRTLFSG